MVGALSSFFTLQFGLGYYTIFEVSWLGWDLVEPFTYTVGQGSFVLGLVYMYRNRKRGVEYSEIEERFKQTGIDKWYYLENRQKDRLRVLEDELAKLDHQITETKK